MTEFYWNLVPRRDWLVASNISEWKDNRLVEGTDIYITGASTLLSHALIQSKDCWVFERQEC